ncbi:MAG: winged helix-turn-helix domain-containing protein [Chloroflexi bacterium]|nr:winged helix-turn-helix domain-containing protein [Chloroflexota bacterium]MBP7042348.1 winged helix-turn-helix domain-containing protein [Chloroflexota bacterium]
MGGYQYRIVAHRRREPGATFSHIGQQIDRSKTTVSNYVRELEQDGRLQRNGSGWQVLS